MNTKDLLKRVVLKTSFKDLSKELCEQFLLGNPISFKPMKVGYEELNTLLITSTGKFVVKIFSKNKSLDVIKSNLTALIEYSRGGIPSPKLYKSLNGDFLYKVKNHKSTYLIVMDFFDGKKFTEIDPTEEDKKNIANILGNIHKLQFKTSANYDIWLTKNLVKEFELKRKYLSNSEELMILPIVERLKKVDYSKLSKSIVHFDLHREKC